MESIDNGKAKIRSSARGVEISIPSKKNWFALIFGVVWLGGWYFALKNTLVAFVFNNDRSGGMDGFIAFWLLCWIIGGVLIIGLLLWGFFGKEILRIENDKIILNKNVFGVGKKRKLKRSGVKNIRFNKVEINYFSGRNNWAIWGVGEGKIKFDYGMKTYSLASGVDDAEAEYLIEMIKENCEIEG